MCAASIQCGISCLTLKRPFPGRKGLTQPEPTEIAESQKEEQLSEVIADNLENANRALWFSAIPLLASLLGGLALAEDKDAARREYAEGTRRYDLNEFGPALEAFKRAYLAYEDPAFLYNIAQCYRQLGDEVQRDQFYRSYLRKLPDAANADEVRSTISSLESAIAADKAKVAATPAAVAPTSQIGPRRVEHFVGRQSACTIAHSVYKKWWLWTIVSVVAAGAATGVAIAVTSQRTENSFMPVTVSR